MLLALGLTFAVTILLGVPIAVCLGLSSLAAVLLAPDVPFRMIPERMVSAVDSFPLMAIPFFMLAGELMDMAGILSRLIAFAQALVGHIRGGLAHVTVVTEMILSGVTGTAVGDAMALGTTLMPAMEREYGKDFAAAVVASAASLGPLIPPSAAMIVYSYMSGGSVSVAALFMAGVVPGVFMGLATMVMCYVMAKRRGYATRPGGISWAEALRQVRRALLVLVMPVVVLGGMLGGVFTATEAGAIAVVYALAIGLFVTGELKIRELPGALIRAGITTSVVILLIALASSVTFLLTVQQVPTALADAITGFSRNPTVFLTLVMVLLVIVGMLLESNAAYIMLVPIFHPIAVKLGIDPLHFGFVFVFNLVIGMLTPPVGVVLFVICGLSGMSVERLVRAAWPFILLQFAVLVVCVYFPWTYIWFPRLLGY